MKRRKSSQEAPKIPVERMTLTRKERTGSAEDTRFSFKLVINILYFRVSVKAWKRCLYAAVWNNPRHWLEWIIRFTVESVPASMFRSIVSLCWCFFSQNSCWDLKARRKASFLTFRSCNKKISSTWTLFSISTEWSVLRTISTGCSVSI